jgi:hypothetical protein
MLLGDPLHDGESEPGALDACGHVRLDQAIAVLLRQTATIVDNGDVHVVALGGDLRGNVAGAGASRIGLHRRVDALARVLYEIGHGLGQETLVRHGHDRLLRQIELELDVRTAHLE